jgi:UV DNA damage repair endonuclease
VLDCLAREDIGMYRMASSLAPYATHPDLPQLHAQVDESREELAVLGERARELGIRLSTHRASTSSSTRRTPACGRARSATSSCRRS